MSMNFYFRAFDLEHVFVLGSDGNLWLEQPLPGVGWIMPPARVQIDAKVAAFQAFDLEHVFVLGSDGNLWLEQPLPGVGWIMPPARVQIDANVAAFQAFDLEHVFVLGTDGNLWLEQPLPGVGWGTVPPPRVQVAAKVWAFQAFDLEHVFVLENDPGGLGLRLYEASSSPQGQPLWSFPPLPPPIVIHAGAFGFQALDLEPVFVLDGDVNLWLDRAPFGNVPPLRAQIDANVGQWGTRSDNATQTAFQGFDLEHVFVRGEDGNLWLEQPLPGVGWGAVPPPERWQIDANVAAFQAFDLEHVFVLGTDGNLWLEQPLPGVGWGAVPPPERWQIDANVHLPAVWVDDSPGDDD